ncbi:cutinase-domain-containing protein [Lasiosphaeris hirsuta]|uniref:Cutinase-domain-containing protein n=1 Tax=Lasiosphaeris hirsuta TaxID=260670 RepID=A0AA40BDJ3_9PEZI|nr:cutinase-domain-containing protein [Lasiosphaeris hirsuta]
MHLFLLALAGLAASQTTVATPRPCATGGIHMLVARGSTEMPGLGRIGVVAGNVTLLLPGSTVAAVNYPATFEQYTVSEATGATIFAKMVAEYVAACPDTKIALLGYSQGGQAVMDALCGNSEEGFMASADLAAGFRASVVAAVTFGDPSHTLDAPWNVGTSNRTGIFPRRNLTSCEPYTDTIRGWCDEGDVYCDRGNNTRTHGSYFANYTLDAAEFIVERYNASLTTTLPATPTPSSTWASLPPPTGTTSTPPATSSAPPASTSSTAVSSGTRGASVSPIGVLLVEVSASAILTSCLLPMILGMS